MAKLRAENDAPLPVLRPEYLLPGVSDSATIIFTVLHQAPTKVVCLGQALVEPKQFSRNEEHVQTVALAKQQASQSARRGLRKLNRGGSRGALD